MQKHITLYLNHLKTRGCSHHTRRNYECSLRRFCAFLAGEGIDTPRDVTADHLAAYQDHLFHNEKTRRGNRSLSLEYQSHLLQAVRVFFRFLRKHDIVLHDPARNLKSPKLPRRLPRDVMTRREIKKILSLPDTRLPLGLRDRLILELLYATGLRNSELCNLKLQDVNTAARELIIRNGKGAKDRIVPVVKKTATLIDRWITEARPVLLGERQSEWLFIGPASPYPYLKTGRIAVIVRSYRERARLKKKVTPHSFRHTCATHLLQGRASIRTIQELLGHKSLSTTQQYTRVDVTDLRRAVDRHHPRESMDL